MKKNFYSFLVFALMGQTVLAADFSDVDENTYYQSSIEWMAGNGIINGYEDGTFKPDQCVNRVELLKMLFETLEVDMDGYKTYLFQDTPADQWYAPYVSAARQRGTVQGYADGKFRPEQCVSRMEAIKMAILEFNDGEVPETWHDFEPADDIETMAKNASENGEDLWWLNYYYSAASANTIADLHFEKNFGPDESMTRKEVAEMLYRMKTVKDNGLARFVDDGSAMPKNIGEIPEVQEPASLTLVDSLENVPFTQWMYDLMEDSISVRGGYLSFDVGHATQLGAHEFELYWDGTFLESDPVQANLYLVDNSSNDESDPANYMTETLKYDLSELKTAYTEGYQQENGSIIVIVNGLDQAYSSIWYEF